MTTIFDNIVDEVKRATDFQKNKKILREKVQTDLHMPFNGGMFKLTPEIFAFVSVWPDDTLYLEDIYQSPVQINKQQFLIAAQEQYQKVMNYWHNEYEELKRIRKV